jgi:hypothetical protein
MYLLISILIAKEAKCLTKYLYQFSDKIQNTLAKNNYKNISQILEFNEYKVSKRMSNLKISIFDENFSKIVPLSKENFNLLYFSIFKDFDNNIW